MADGPLNGRGRLIKGDDIAGPEVGPAQQSPPAPLRPSNADLKVFLDTVAKLDLFEAEHRHRHGWGTFDPATLPILEVVRTVAWLVMIANG